MWSAANPIGVDTHFASARSRQNTGPFCLWSRTASTQSLSHTPQGGFGFRQSPKKGEGFPGEGGKPMAVDATSCQACSDPTLGREHPFE